ncbi:hypothetical protein E2C01_099407 [Portunus trituberculatus]|uniref:Uncharacterized protein n=1 Tax=Portunus trituberculatus TaxID=210409 RepID=A0A5B7KAA2_PORTR|nr:hypothetical protein [Portunus trituberculatus]
MPFIYFFSVPSQIFQVHKSAAMGRRRGVGRARRVTARPSTVCGPLLSVRRLARFSGRHGNVLGWLCLRFVVGELPGFYFV